MQQPSAAGQFHVSAADCGCGFQGCSVWDLRGISGLGDLSAHLRAAVRGRPPETPAPRSSNCTAFLILLVISSLDARGFWPGPGRGVLKLVSGSRPLLPLKIPQGRADAPSLPTPLGLRAPEQPVCAFLLKGVVGAVVPNPVTVAGSRVSPLLRGGLLTCARCRLSSSDATMWFGGLPCCACRCST